MSNLFLIISREYTERVRKKGFIVTTLVMPIVILALMFAPALLSGVGQEQEIVTIIDKSGKITPRLATEASMPYKFIDEPYDSVSGRDDLYPILVLEENIVEDPAQATLYSKGSTGLMTIQVLTDDIKNVIEQIRLEDYDIKDLKSILDEVNADVTIVTREVKDDGTDESSDALTGFLIGVAMAFILYMFILIYGQLVMQSIIEEKNNRVLEIIVTSVKPSQLMLGKILGIGAVAVTQVLIWGALITAFVTFAMPSLMGADIFGELEALRNGTLDPSAAETDLSVLQVLAMLTSLKYLFSVFGYLIAFLFGGFVLYASIFAVIGASVDNAQDGAQLQIFANVPVILGLVFAMTAAQSPDSSIAFWLSIIPFTSPMVMMARIPLGVDLWQIILSLVLLYATIMFTIWFTAKIYRVGIFMYGKKPSVKELIKWARYK